MTERLNLEDENNLSRIAGGFTGLGDDDEVVERFRHFDPDDQRALAAVIEEFVLPDFLSASDRERQVGIALLREVASWPRAVQEREWDSHLPPFDYPLNTNLYLLMLDVLEAHR